MANGRLLAFIDRRMKEVGIRSPRQLCLQAKLGPDAVRDLRRRNVEPKTSTLKALAGPLRTSVAEMLEYVDPLDPEAPTDVFEAEEDLPVASSSLAAPPGYVFIRRLAATPGMGGGGISDDDFGEPELLPSALVEGQLRGAPEDFLIMEVDGQSMEPILLSRDVVVADRRKTNPSQEGIFLLYDGSGLTVKWVSRVPKSDPPKLRIQSENPRFDPYEVLTDETRIIGRVVWYARQM